MEGKDSPQLLSQLVKKVEDKYSSIPSSIPLNKNEDDVEKNLFTQLPSQQLVKELENIHSDIRATSQLPPQHVKELENIYSNLAAWFGSQLTPQQVKELENIYSSANVVS